MQWMFINNKATHKNLHLIEFQLDTFQVWRFLLDLLDFLWWIFLLFPYSFAESLNSIVNLAMRPPWIYPIDLNHCFCFGKVQLLSFLTFFLCLNTISCGSLRQESCSVRNWQIIFLHQATRTLFYSKNLWRT